MLSQTTAENRTLSDHDSMLSSPIFVTGYMHSATTLTQRVLGRHSQVFSGGGETRHFSHLPVIKDKFCDLDDARVLRAYIIYLLRVICTGYGRTNVYHTDKDSLEVIASCGLTEADVERLLAEVPENGDHTALIGMVYDYLTIRAGKSRWLDKSPSYIVIIDELLARYPYAHVVILVRDPRDILASKLRRSKTKANYDPVWDTVSWRAAVRAGDAARKKHPDQIIRVRYEDMVARPESEFRRLCRFLDLPYESEILQVDWTNTSIEGLKGSGIGTQAIGNWRATLPQDDVFICQQLAKHEMTENEYEPDHISSNVRLKSPIIIARSAGNLLKRLRKKWVRGGKTHVLNTIKNYKMRFVALRKGS